jgi:hypothetical protein
VAIKDNIIAPNDIIANQINEYISQSNPVNKYMQDIACAAKNDIVAIFVISLVLK